MHKTRLIADDIVCYCHSLLSDVSSLSLLSCKNRLNDCLLLSGPSERHDWSMSWAPRLIKVSLFWTDVRKMWYYGVGKRSEAEGRNVLIRGGLQVEKCCCFSVCSQLCRLRWMRQMWITGSWMVAGWVSARSFLRVYEICKLCLIAMATQKKRPRKCGVIIRPRTDYFHDS